MHVVSYLLGILILILSAALRLTLALVRLSMSCLLLEVVTSLIDPLVAHLHLNGALISSFFSIEVTSALAIAEINHISFITTTTNNTTMPTGDSSPTALLSYSPYWIVVSWAPLLIGHVISAAICTRTCKLLREAAVTAIRKIHVFSILLYLVTVVCIWDTFVLSYRQMEEIDSRNTLAFIQASCIGRWAEFAFAVGCFLCEGYFPLAVHRGRFKLQLFSLKILPLTVECAACFWFVGSGADGNVGTMGSVILTNSIHRVYSALKTTLLKRLVLIGPLSKPPSNFSKMFNYLTNGVYVYGWRSTRRLDDDAECPICLNLLCEAPFGSSSITLVCGHSLHECCAIDCLQKMQLCPMCKVWPGRLEAALALTQSLPKYLESIGAPSLQYETPTEEGGDGNNINTTDQNGTQGGEPVDGARPSTPRQYANDFRSNAFTEYLLSEFNVAPQSLSLTLPSPSSAVVGQQHIHQQVSRQRISSRFRGKRSREGLVLTSASQQRCVTGPAVSVLLTKKAVVKKARGKRTIREDDGSNVTSAEGPSTKGVRVEK